MRRTAATAATFTHELLTADPGNIGFDYSAIFMDTTDPNRSLLEPSDRLTFTGIVDGRAVTSVTDFTDTGDIATPPALVVNQNDLVNRPGLHNLLIRLEDVVVEESTSGDWLLTIGTYVTQYFLDLPPVTAGQTYTYVYGIADTDQAAKRIMPRAFNDLGTTN